MSWSLFTLAWLHDIDPFLLRISGNFGIRWYGIAYLLGFAFGYFVLRQLARKKLIPLTPEMVSDFILAVIIGILAGGRLGSVFFYNIDLLWTFTKDPPWWGVLAINKGGMASHGGMIGCLVASWLFARKHKLRLLSLTDLITFAAPFGLFAGRIANFINGELLGRVVPPGEHLPWAVKFPQEMSIYWDTDRLARLEPLCYRFSIEPGTWIHALANPEDKASVNLIYRFTQQLTEAIQHHDKAVIAVVEPLLSPRHPSQLYQAFAEGIVLGLIMLIIWAKPRRTGVLTAWFLMVYGVLRIVTEYWRLPDVNLAVKRIAGLSRGQLLSIPLILAGGFILYYSLKNKPDKQGGWLSGRKIREEETTPTI